VVELRDPMVDKLLNHVIMHSIEEVETFVHKTYTGGGDASEKPEATEVHGD
jgi:hypothetical protein